MAYLRRSEIIRIPLDSIQPNPYQPRKEFPEEEIRELADSIQNNGLIQKPSVMPMVDEQLQPIEGQYILISGERRLRAYQHLYHTTTEFQYGTIEVIVDTFEITNPDSYRQRLMVNALAENINRSDLTIIEKAQSIITIREETGKSYAEIGEMLGKVGATLKNYVSLYNALTEDQRAYAISKGLGRRELEKIARKNRQEKEGHAGVTGPKRAYIKPKKALQIYYHDPDLQQSTNKQIQAFIQSHQQALSDDNLARMEHFVHSELNLHDSATIFFLLKKYIEDRLSQ